MFDHLQKKLKNHHRGVAQFGRALRSGRRGRGFESRHLDQNRGFYRNRSRRGNSAALTYKGGYPWKSTK